MANTIRLKFTYKGQTSVLQSSTDIATWIEERKKRFPTMARKAENDAHMQKLKEEREALKAKKLLERQLKTLEKDKKAAREAAAAKSKHKVEKLRRKLEKEERRAAKVEAKTLKRNAPQEADEARTHEAKKRRCHSSSTAKSAEDSDQELGKTEATDFNDREKGVQSSKGFETSSKLGDNHLLKGSQPIQESGKDVKQEPQGSIQDPLTPTSQPSLPGKDDEQPHKPASAVIHVSAVERKLLEDPVPDSHGVPNACTLTRQEELDNTITTSSSNTEIHSDESSDDEDNETTSSGSSSSASESDSEEGPETISSRRARPQKVLPPKKGKNQNKAICRDFLRTGRCRRGKRCRWRHALPDRVQKKAEESVLSRPERKSLHQRVCTILRCFRGKPL